MKNEIVKQPLAAEIEQVLVGGDLSRLNEVQRLSYYKSVCDSLGLNPLTKPFDYLRLGGKLILYARKDCTEQLRKIHGVSITDLDAMRQDDVYVVTAKARDKDGRTDCSTGAVSVGRLQGEALANAIMKAETKAKRRVTLSLCGLGMLDETEIESVDPRPAFDQPAAATINGREIIEQIEQAEDERHVQRVAAALRAKQAAESPPAESEIPAEMMDEYHRLHDLYGEGAEEWKTRPVEDMIAHVAKIAKKRKRAIDADFLEEHKVEVLERLAAKDDKR